MNKCLFRGIVHTKNGTKLRVSGGLSIPVSGKRSWKPLV